MAYRPYRGRNKGSSRRSNDSNRTYNEKRVGKLNLRRLGEFKYDVREVFEHNEVDPEVASTFLASVIAKASRQSIKDAKDYVKESHTAGMVSQEVSEDLCVLLDRYTKYQTQQLEHA